MALPNKITARFTGVAKGARAAAVGGAVAGALFSGGVLNASPALADAPTNIVRTNAQHVWENPTIFYKTACFDDADTRYCATATYFNPIGPEALPFATANHLELPPRDTPGYDHWSAPLRFKRLQ